MRLMLRPLLPVWIAIASASVAGAQSPIKVGEFASLTGKEATYGQAAHKGTILAVEEINAAGGVLGRKIELVSEDDQSKPGESATIAKKLISRDKVVTILGEIVSSRSLEAAPICQAAHIPQIAPGSTALEVTAVGNYIFRACFLDRFQGTVMAKFAHDTLKAKRVAVISSVSSAESVGLAKYFRERFIADGGVVAADQKYAEGDKDFRAQLTAIKAAGVEGIFVPAYYAEAALICKQARDLGITAPLFGIDGWESPQLVEIGGSAVEGSYFLTHFSADNHAPEVVRFTTTYEKRWGAPADTLAALGYDSVMLFADAVKRAGTTENVKLRDALAATKNFKAVTGTITFDQQRNPTKSAVVLQVKNGRFVFVQSIEP
jgi:branched-chain amino acid transport system substrate-binding protein